MKREKSKIIKIKPYVASFEIEDRERWGVALTVKYKDSDDYRWVFWHPKTDTLWRWETTPFPEHWSQRQMSDLSEKRLTSLKQVWEDRPMRRIG